MESRRSNAATDAVLVSYRSHGEHIHPGAFERSRATSRQGVGSAPWDDGGCVADAWWVHGVRRDAYEWVMKKRSELLSCLGIALYRLRQYSSLVCSRSTATLSCTNIVFSNHLFCGFLSVAPLSGVLRQGRTAESTSLTPHQWLSAPVVPMQISSCPCGLALPRATPPPARWIEQAFCIWLYQVSALKTKPSLRQRA